MDIKKKIKEILIKNKKSIIILPIMFIASILLAIYVNTHIEVSYRLQRAILYFFLGWFIYIIRPKSCIHKILVKDMTKLHKLGCASVVIITIIVAVYPMSLNEVWSKPGWGHHTQYEDFTESLMRGHIYFDDYEVDEKLNELDNPYDLHQRNKAKVSARWDHAFYEGKYYMYYGIVPVIILFIPLKLVGISIISSQATQIFVAFTILGVFTLFYEMAKKLCPKMTMSAYLATSIAVSWMSIWFAVMFPALYCTAIMGGICLAIWGFFFCFKAFIVDKTKGKIIRDTILGALFSALVFGCRPTIGFISLAYIPMIWYFLNKNINEKLKIKEWFKKVTTKENIIVAIAFCMPYIIVAICLMTYNYARFENPFEFGQSYQLTGFDQHNYMEGNSVTLGKITNAFLWSFFHYNDVTDTFPYINFNGVFINFPILLLMFYNFNLFHKKKENNEIKGLASTLLLAVIIICLFQVAWAPTMETRYSLDYNFILGIMLMLSVCRIINNYEEEATKNSFKITLFATVTVITCFLLFFVQFDSSLAELDRELAPNVAKFLLLK